MECSKNFKKNKNMQGIYAFLLLVGIGLLLNVLAEKSENMGKLNVFNIAVIIFLIVFVISLFHGLNYKLLDTIDYEKFK